MPLPTFYHVLIQGVFLKGKKKKKNSFSFDTYQQELPDNLSLKL